MDGSGSYDQCTEWGIRLSDVWDFLLVAGTAISRMMLQLFVEQCIGSTGWRNHTSICVSITFVQFNSIQLLYSRLNSIIYIQVVQNNLRSI